MVAFRLPLCTWGTVALLLASGSTEASAQDMARVRQTLRTLTAKRMHGRGYTHQGHTRAAALLAKRFQQLGLQSWHPHYQQPFTLNVNTFSGQLAVNVQGRSLRAGVDFIPDPASGSAHGTYAVAYLDSLVLTQDGVRQQWLDESLRGKALVCSQRVFKMLSQQPTLQRKLAEAAALIVLIDGKLTASVADTQLPQARLLVHAASWPMQARQVCLNLDAELRTNLPTQNVSAYARGTAVPDSFLFITAHYDHLGELGRKDYFPGANDNASGTTMLLELATYFAQPAHRLRYSVAFIAFSGEEAGLLGSQYFAQHAPVPLPNIRFLLNLDLVGTGAEGITVVNGKLHPAEFALVQQLAATPAAAVGTVAGRGRAANSDHYPFSELGVPAFFWYTRGGPSAYHDVQDQAGPLPLTIFPQLFNLARVFLTSLSE